MRNSWKNQNTGKRRAGFGRRAAAFVLAAFMTVTTMQSDLVLISQAASRDVTASATSTSSADKKSPVPSEARNKGAITLTQSNCRIWINESQGAFSTPNVPRIPFQASDNLQIAVQYWDGATYKPVVQGTGFDIASWDNVDGVTNRYSSVTITGKGSYSGTLTVYFMLIEDISTSLYLRKHGQSTEIPFGSTESLFSKVYNGSALADGDSLTGGGTISLSSLFDISVGSQSLNYDSSYGSLANGYWITSGDVDCSTSADFTIHFGSEFGYQTADFKYTITARPFASNVSLSSISPVVYDGTAKTPAVTVTDTGLGRTLSQGTDYTIVYTNNTDAGTGTVTVTGKGNYDGTTKTVNFTIAQKNISSGAVVTLPDGGSYTYTGSSIRPEPVVVVDGVTLTKGTDYTLDYNNNQQTKGANEPGAPTVTITGTGNYTGSVVKTFSIVNGSLQATDVTFSYGSWSDVSNTNATTTIASEERMGLEYTGAALEPGIEVKKDGVTLSSGVDYEIAYSDNTDAYKKNNKLMNITITGKGSYSGTVKITAKIKQKPISSDDIEVTKGGTNNTGVDSSKNVAITLKNGSATMTKVIDYTYTPEKVTKAGNTEITITGVGNYTGTRKESVGSGTDISACNFKLFDPLTEQELTNAELAYYPSQEYLKPIVKLDLNGNGNYEEAGETIYSADGPASGFTVTFSNSTITTGAQVITIKAADNSASYYNTRIIDYNVVKRNIKYTTSGGAQIFYRVTVNGNNSGKGTDLKDSSAVTSINDVPNEGKNLSLTGDKFEISLVYQKTSGNDFKVLPLKYGTDYTLSKTMLNASETEAVPVNITGTGGFSSYYTVNLKWGKKALSSPSITLRYVAEDGTESDSIPTITYDGSDHKLKTASIAGTGEARVYLYDEDAGEPISETEYELQEATGYKTSPKSSNFRDAGQTIKLIFSAKAGAQTYTGTNTSYSYSIKMSEASLYEMSVKHTKISGGQILYTGHGTWTGVTVEVKKKNSSQTLTEGVDYTWVEKNTEATFSTHPGDKQIFTVQGIKFAGTLTQEITVKEETFSNDNLKSGSYLYSVEPAALQTAIDNDEDLHLTLQSDGTLKDSGGNVFSSDLIKVKDVNNQEVAYTKSVSGLNTPGKHTITLSGDTGSAKVTVYTKQKISGAHWTDGEGDSDTMDVPWTGSLMNLGSGKLGISIGDVKLDSSAYTATVKKGGSVSGIMNIGAYTVTLTANGAYYEGTATLYLNVLYDLSAATVTFPNLEANGATYDSANLQKATVVIGSKTWTNVDSNGNGTNGDFTVTYDDPGTTLPKDVAVTLSAVGGRSMKEKNASYRVDKLPFGDRNITAELKTGASLTYDPSFNTQINWGNYLTVKDTNANKVLDYKGVTTSSTTTETGQGYYVLEPQGFRNSAGTPQANESGWSLTIVCLGTDTAFSGSTLVSFPVKKKDLSTSTIHAGKVMYAGGKQVSPSKFYDEVGGNPYELASSDIDRIVATGTNVGTNNAVTVYGTGNYKNSKATTYEITKLDLADSSVRISVTSPVTYNGKVRNPSVTVSIPSAGGEVALSSSLYNIAWSPSELKDARSYDLIMTAGDNASVTLTGTERKETGAFVIEPYTLTADDVNVTDVPGFTLGDTVTVENQVQVSACGSSQTTFTVSPATITEPGKYTITITGSDNLSGTVTKTIEVGRDISKCNNPTISKKYDGTATIPTTQATWKNLKWKGSDTLTYGTDFEVDATTAVNAGQAYTITLTGKGRYFGTKALTYVIDPEEGNYAYIKFTDSRIHTDESPFYMYYSGSPMEPEFEVYVRTTVNNVTTDKKQNATEFTYSFTNNTNVGTATLNVTLANYVRLNVASNIPASFAIKPVDLSETTFTASFSGGGTTINKKYTGSAITPNVVIEGTNPDGITMLLIPNSDYTLTYTNNTKAGEATATITGKGNFTGTRGLKFYVIGDFGATTSKFTIPKQMYTGQSISKLVNAVVEVGGNTLKETTDYTVTLTSSDNWETKGTAVFTPVSGSKYYTGTKSVDFTISGDSSMYTVRGVANAYTYSGSAIKPIALITDANGNGINYKTNEVTYKNTSDGSACIKPGMVTMTIPLTAGTASTNKSESRNKGAVINTNKEIKYQILQKNINSCSIGTASNVAYDGKAHTPEISIINGSIALAPNTDYTIAYQNNIYPGRAKIKLTGKGNYTGSADVYFSITMPDVKNLKATATAAGKIKVSWKKSTGTFTGYRISYRAGSGTQKQVTVGKNKTSKVLSKLSAGKTYTIIIQTYYKASSGKIGYGNATVVTQDSKPAKATSVKATAMGNRKIKLTWKKVSGASGYMIYRKAGNGKYSRIRTITNGNTVSFTNTGLTKGTKYTYRVLTYRLNGTKRTYSDYSAAATVKVK